VLPLHAFAPASNAFMSGIQHSFSSVNPSACTCALCRMPTYYATQFGLDVGHSAALSVLPWGLNVVCANAAGYVGDKVRSLKCCPDGACCASHCVQRSQSRTGEQYFDALKCVQMLNDWGVDRTLTRKLMQALGSMGPAACLFALAADQGADRPVSVWCTCTS
jgi:hypothetical protein